MFEDWFGADICLLDVGGVYSVPRTVLVVEYVLKVMIWVTFPDRNDSRCLVAGSRTAVFVFAREQNQFSPFLFCYVLFWLFLTLSLPLFCFKL